MDKLLQHITIEGERWDSIALKMYGSASMMNKVMEANPDVPRDDRLPAGVILDIPIINEAEVLTDAEKLPPWKRP